LASGVRLSRKAIRPPEAGMRKPIRSTVMTNKSKYAGLGIALGAALGAVFGVLAGHMGVWLAIGVAIGMVLGASFRRKETVCPECAQIHRTHEMRRQA
jgi:hypothetical protein